VKPVKSRELEEALRKHGFVLDRSTNDKIYYLHYRGKKTSVFTKISHGSGEELGFRLLKMIQAQLRLDTQRQLQEFIDNTMDATAYIVHLKGKGVIREEARPHDRR
jgi:hypothetical protein